MEEPVHFNYLMTSRRSPLNGPRKIHSWSCQTPLALQSSQEPRRVAPVELSASVFHLNHFSSREWSVLLWPSRKTKSFADRNWVAGGLAVCLLSLTDAWCPHLWAESHLSLHSPSCACLCRLGDNVSGTPESENTSPSRTRGKRTDLCL